MSTLDFSIPGCNTCYTDTRHSFIAGKLQSWSKKSHRIFQFICSIRMEMHNYSKKNKGYFFFFKSQMPGMCQDGGRVPNPSTWQEQQQAVCSGDWLTRFGSWQVPLKLRLPRSYLDSQMSLHSS
ncbi:mCG1041728 [Mus musculus]|nr:mCG1041728 [Mus musculus]